MRLSAPGILQESEDAPVNSAASPLVGNDCHQLECARAIISTPVRHIEPHTSSVEQERSNYVRNLFLMTFTPHSSFAI